ncbi:esterase [Paenibacillus glycanilyticus]|uniref:Esterase n=1 Tax=Paenibacillus glycanilyticus TaxID=126569 RepID=A0ABQ6NW39_9BACL|nr:alpha/beta fold hydrolase [Paenibacillus glycanilyticus]GMK49059.1 esterase [Paenibacillus glycanilyticus]
MSTFVFVHGSWHGAWCWDKIIFPLQEEGHRVITFDLPGHGLDKTPVNQVTLKDYTDRLCTILDNEEEKVILVGHSMAGLVISQTAEYRPEKIQTLVYLCAYLPKNGQSLIQIAQSEKKEDDSPSLVVISEDQTFLSLNDELIRYSFYGDCSDQDVTKAREKLCLEPFSPFVTPVTLTEKNFGSLPRVYIETLKDKAISLNLQRKMYSESLCKAIISLDSDHSPFYSQPHILAYHLKNIAKVYGAIDKK